MISDLGKENLQLLLESVKYKGCIVTGGGCRIGCKFCYLRESRKSSSYIPLNIPFISKPDFKKALFTAKRYKYRTVTLGDGVDLISSEPFIHPLIYEFIEELEGCSFIDRISITTSGLYIKENKYAFLEKCKKIGWVISCSSLSEEGRESVVLTKDCSKLLDFLHFLHSANWKSVHSLQLVIHALKYFLKDLEIIKNNFPKFIPAVYIRELAYNKFFSREAKTTIDECRKEFKKVLRYFSHKKISLCWDDTSLDEDFDLKYRFSGFRNTVNSFITQINVAIVNCVKNNFKAPLLCLPDSCFFVLPKVKDRIVLPKLKKGYLRVKNRTFGGHYKCYGLLFVDDFYQALKYARLKDYDVVVLNGVFLNSDQCDLRRRHISELKKSFQIPFMIM